ncbi:MAG: RDD family protein [Pyrinomonadaceae bacterium]
MNDTVREELQAKITSGRLTPRVEIKEPIAEPMEYKMAVGMPNRMIQPSQFASPVKAADLSVKSTPPTKVAPPPARIAPPPVKRVVTANLAAPKTSPTLVGFQNKNATMPDWRIQLQNAVQQRKGSQPAEDVAIRSADQAAPAAAEGGISLKAEVVQRVESRKTETEIKDPRVANAMRRITESRNTFLDAGKAEKKASITRPVPLKPYPFDVVSTTNDSNSTHSPGWVGTQAKPTLVNRVAGEKRDTNKLPPIIVANESKIDIYETSQNENESGPLPSEFAEIKRIRIKADTPDLDRTEIVDDQTEEIEDLAQFSMRFGAGLFDLIIAGFTSFVLLSPVAFKMGQWFTTTGLLAFAGVAAILMFLYMTVCLGFYGKTLGMRLFSLELVDAVENEYPTLHQAAVSSSVFILSLVFGGAGFLTVFFNEEKRAAHDLLSGTILVREF